MTVKQIFTKYWEGLDADDKPTGVVAQTVYRATDTRRVWITYDGTNWVIADKRVRLVNEDGTYVDIPGEFDALEVILTDVLGNVAILEHYNHSRSRVYPQDIRLVAELVAAAANVFGDWVEIIPIDTVDFDYEATGFVIEEADAAGSYLVQIGFSLVALTEPTTTQIAGERRIKLPTPVTQSTGILEIKSQNIPANAKLWGKVKSKAGGSETIGISVSVARHIEITNPIAKLVTWPWST